MLDGGLDADRYINRPLEHLRARSAGFERALGRFFQACAATKAVCPFGGADPWNAFDELVERLNASPVAASDGRTVDGEDLLAGAARRCTRRSSGASWPWRRHCWVAFEHTWWKCGYAELPYGLMPVRPRGGFYGPFEVPASAVTALVVGTTYDPATTYREAQLLAREVGKARLLTMRGDGHTAYGGNSRCIDAAVDAYLEDGVVPAPGIVCRQEVPFASPPVSARAARADVRAARLPRVVSEALAGRR